MYSFPTSIAQEQAIENMVNSKHFGGFPYKVEDGGTSHGKHFVILSIELPNGTLREALRPDGSADHYFWGVKGFEEWHRLFYGE